MDSERDFVSLKCRQVCSTCCIFFNLFANIEILSLPWLFFPDLGAGREDPGRCKPCVFLFHWDFFVVSLIILFE